MGCERRWYTKRQIEKAGEQVTFDAFQLWYWSRQAAEKTGDDDNVREAFAAADTDGSGTVLSLVSFIRTTLF